MGFFRSGFTVAALKGAGIMPEVRGGVDQKGKEWQDVVRVFLEKGGGNRVKGTGGGTVRHH